MFLVHCAAELASRPPTRAFASGSNLTSTAADAGYVHTFRAAGYAPKMPAPDEPFHLLRTGSIFVPTRARQTPAQILPISHHAHLTQHIAGTLAYTIGAAVKRRLLNRHPVLYRGCSRSLPGSHSRHANHRHHGLAAQPHGIFRMIFFRWRLRDFGWVQVSITWASLLPHSAHGPASLPLPRMVSLLAGSGS